MLPYKWWLVYLDVDFSIKSFINFLTNRTLFYFIVWFLSIVILYVLLKLKEAYRKEVKL